MHAIPSRRFIEALKLNVEPAYRIAWRAGVHPNTLSKLTSGYIRPRMNDPRIVAVGRELGLAPEACFEPAATTTIATAPERVAVSAPA